MIPPTNTAVDARQGLFDLAPPFWGKPRIASWLLAYLYAIQKIENAIDDTKRRHTIEGADDEGLRVLGAIVGEPRGSQSTERYRDLIRARIRANRSIGGMLDIADVARLVVPGGVWSFVAGNRGIVAWLLDPVAVPAARGRDVARLLNDTRAAGFAMSVIFMTDSDPLTLDGPVATLTGLTYAGSGETAYPMAYAI